MRPQDIKRATRAVKHLKDALTALSSISWVYLTREQDNLVARAKNEISMADKYLDELLALNDK